MTRPADSRLEARRASEPASPRAGSDAQAAETWAEERRNTSVARAAVVAETPRRRTAAEAPTVSDPVRAPAVPVGVGGAAWAVPAGGAEPAEPLEPEVEERRGLRRPKVRIVRSTSSRRLIRRIDTWTVFKVSLVFYLLTLIILVGSGIILWNLAEAAGTIISIQKSARSLFNLSHFVIKPIPLLEYSAAGGAILSVMATIVNTIFALLYNLISDVVGGVQVVVVAEPD